MNIQNNSYVPFFRVSKNNNFINIKRNAFERTPMTDTVSFRGGFIPARTIKEAEDWGKINLGIKEYLCNTKLGILNYIHEGMYDVKQKFGKDTFLPNFVDELASNGDVVLAVGTDRENQKYLVIFRDWFKELDKSISMDINYLVKLNVFKKALKTQNLELAPLFQSDKAPEFENLVNKYMSNPKKCTVKEKITLWQGFDFILNKLESFEYSLKGKWFQESWLTERKGYWGIDYLDGKASVYHEIGHLMHEKVIGFENLSKMLKLEQMEKIGIEDTSVTVDFLNDKRKQKIAGLVSKYAKASPAEFVAEVFSQLMCGKKQPNNVMKLYRYYNGPKFPRNSYLLCKT